MSQFPRNGGNGIPSQTRFHDNALLVIPCSTFIENVIGNVNVNDLWVNRANVVPPMFTAQFNEHYHPIPLFQHVTRIESDQAKLQENPKSSLAPDQPKKRVTWTEDEHRLFLVGLDEYGKGKWTDISRKVVKTKTPAQVASHAQKYFLHLRASSKKEKKRKSIHDMTLQDTHLVVPRHIDQQNCISAPNFSMQRLQEMHQAQSTPHLDPPNDV